MRRRQRRDGGRTGPGGAAPSPAGSVRRLRRGAVRLLHSRIPGHGEGAPRRKTARHPWRDCRRSLRESLPLHRLHPDLRSGGRGGGKDGTRSAGRGAAMTGPLRVIGKPRRRVDARAKVTGQTQFADDLSFPRMLHCKLLRSPHPHARIVSIDTRAASTAPGVHAVLTGADFPTRYGILPVSQDEEPLCRDRVRMAGDPVAAVIASTETEAADAAALIVVEYEILRTIADSLEALAIDEPRIHEYGDR